MRSDFLLGLQSKALESIGNAVLITNADVVIEWANPAFLELAGNTLDEVIGRRPQDLLESGLRNPVFIRDLSTTIENGIPWRDEPVDNQKVRSLNTESLTITPIRDADGRVAHYVIVEKDDGDRRRREKWQLTKLKLLEKDNGEVSLAALLEDLLIFIQEQCPALHSSILIADEAVGILRPGAARGLPDSYCRLEAGLPIVDGCTSVGTACARGKQVIVRDILDDSSWKPYLPMLGVRIAFHACWSTPLFDSKGGTVGVVSFYMTEPGVPDTEQSELIAYAADVAGLLIERKRETEALQRSNDRFAAILDGVDAYIYVKDADLRYRYANRKVCELFGNSLDEVVGRGDEAFFDVDTSARLRENDRRVLDKGDRVEAEEVNALLESGQTRVYLSVKLPLKDTEGRIHSLCGISTDITDRKRLEEALRESDERLRTAVHSGNVGLWDWNLGTNRVFYSPEWKAQIGYEDHEIGDEFSEWESRVYPDDLERTLQTLRAYLDRPSSIYQAEFRFRHKDGSYRWILTQGALVYEGQQKPTRMLGSHVDITKTKQAEAALKESEEKFRAIFIGARDGIVLIARDSGIIVNCNPEFERQTGRTLEQLKKMRIWELRPPEKRGLAQRLFWKVLAAGEGQASDLEIEKPNGEIVPVEFRATSVTIGASSYIQSITRDITERRREQARLVNLNRVYSLLSNINEAIVRERDLDRLFNEVCRIAVEDGGFLMAWIGLPDCDGLTLQPVAHAGKGKGYLENIQIVLDGGERSFGPTARAFREGRHVYCNDIAKNPAMKPWRLRALELGYRASIALPIKIKGVVRGIYNLYAYQPDFFNDEEIRLLDDLVDDIAFAMELAETEAERRQSEQRLRQAAAVMENTREGVMVTDTEKRIVIVNRAFSEITGFSEIEVLGKKPSMLSSGRHDPIFYSELWSSVDSEGHWQGEIWNRRKNGEVYPELLSVSVVRDHSGEISGYVGVFADISKIKNSEAELEYLAHHDPLTGLSNRLLFLSRLEHGIKIAGREGKQMALLMLDLDRFKDINDSFGHTAGDDLLQQAAGRLMARLRGSDTVSRLGGDEFTVFLEDLGHPKDAARVAEEIIEVLSQPWQLINRAEVRLGVSIGISLFPQHGQSAVELLQHADAALYQAKSEGRGCFKYFSEDLTFAARERIELEARLRRAIDNHELRVYFQPQVDIRSGCVIGAEALVRWMDPMEGVILPECFIQVAEETGLIGAVGEWVLKETCAQGVRWMEAGLPALKLAINVSPHQFLNRDIVALIQETLFSSGFPAHCLELELTESALMERQGEAVQTLESLHELGVRLAIDDFGTGYSSLAYLKRFPLDVLKIDRSFVEDLPNNQDDREIASTIVAMAHTLGLKVLAEAVETEGQLAFLKEQGCDFYQGYLMSPPVSATDFVAFYKNRCDGNLESSS